MNENQNEPLVQERRRNSYPLSALFLCTGIPVLFTIWRYFIAPLFHQEEVKLYYYIVNARFINDTATDELISKLELITNCSSRYDGVVLTDTNIQMMQVEAFRPPNFLKNLDRFHAKCMELKLEVIPLIYGMGAASNIFSSIEPYGSLAAPLRFDQDFMINSKKELVVIPTLKPFENGDFEDGSRSWETDKDGRAKIIKNSTECYSGNQCLVVIPTPNTSASSGYAAHIINVDGHAQLHVKFYAKTKNFNAIQYNVEVREYHYNQSSVIEALGRRISWWPLVVHADQDWTEFNFYSSSWNGDSTLDNGTGLALFVGVEGRNDTQTGEIYFDDISVNEISFMNSLQRWGAMPHATLVTYPNGSAANGENVTHYLQNNITDPNFHHKGYQYTPPNIITAPLGKVNSWAVKLRFYF